MPSLGVSPLTTIDQQTATFTLTGTGTLWTQSPASSLFSVSVGTATAPTVNSDTSATLQVTFGAIGPTTCTFTDNTNGDQAIIPVFANPSPPPHELKATFDTQPALTGTADNQLALSAQFDADTL